VSLREAPVSSSISSAPTVHRSLTLFAPAKLFPKYDFSMDLVSRPSWPSYQENHLTEFGGTPWAQSAIATRRLFGELLAAIDAVLVSVHPRSGM